MHCSRLHLLLVVALGATGITCLDEAPPLACKRMEAPCGGNLVGDWEVIELCMDRWTTHQTPDCPGEQWFEGTHTQGFLTLTEDGRRITKTKGGFTMRSRYPLACFRGMNQFCRILGEMHVTETNKGGMGVSARGGCQARGDDCDCSYTYQVITDVQSTYSVRGNSFVYSDEVGELEREYCVRGSELRMQTPTSTLPNITFRYVRRP